MDLTLNGVDIQRSGGCALDLSGSVLHLTLSDNNTLKSSGLYAGIYCPVGATLMIDGLGSLTATGDEYSAGIGGNYIRDFGDITINGGIVNANGGKYAAGVGGGDNGIMGLSGTVTINGGTIHAQAGHSGAGIGGGRGGSCTVTINGGTVYATGNSGNGGDGIGSGYSGDGGAVNINGGTVTATGGYSGSGIGCGKDGTITIDGGMINATGGNSGAGIGCGDGGTIAVNDGTIMATGGYNSPGIGCGSYPGIVRIKGGIVFAEGLEDINACWRTSGAGRLIFTGTVKVFHKNNSHLYFDQQPPTTQASHWFFTDHTAGDSVHGISVPWAGSFYAYLSLYTLSYGSNGGIGTVPAPLTQLADVNMTVADDSTLSRANYTFAGWNTALDDSGVSYVPGDTYAFPGDTSTNPTLYAQWAAVPYSITYDLAGGTNSPANPTSYTIENAAIKLKNPTKAGFAFAGWTGTDLAELTSIVTIPAGSTGNRAYTANWVAYTPRNLTDTDTGITVTGNSIDPGAVLTVNEITLGNDSACNAIRQRMADYDYTLLLYCDISLSGGFAGALTISLPVDAQYDGQNVTILHCTNGALQTYTATVTGALATLSVTSLSPFAVFVQAPDDGELPKIPNVGDDDGELPKIPNTGDKGSGLLWRLLYGVSAAGFTMLTVAEVWKKTKNR